MKMPLEKRLRKRLHVGVALAENLQPPVDESILKSLVYSGVAPTFRAMVAYLRSV